MLKPEIDVYYEYDNLIMPHIWALCIWSVRPSIRSSVPLQVKVLIKVFG